MSSCGRRGYARGDVQKIRKNIEEWYEVAQLAGDRKFRDFIIVSQIWLCFVGWERLYAEAFEWSMDDLTFIWIESMIHVMQIFLEKNV